MYDPGMGRWLERDPIEKLTIQNIYYNKKSNEYEDGANLYQYVLGSPIRWSDYLGLKVEICKRKPKTDWWLVNNSGKHWWIRTSTKEAGMGPDNGSVPGNNVDSPCGTKTTWNDHTGEGDKPGSRCYTVTGCTEACVNAALPIGTKTGTWCPKINDCNTSIAKVLKNCGCKNRCLKWVVVSGGSLVIMPRTLRCVDWLF